MNSLESVDPQWAWQPFQPSADQPWDRRGAAHLYRRAGFGADVSQLDRAAQLDPAEAVAQLVAQNQETSEFRTVADALAKTVLAGGDPMTLSAAWVYRLLLTPTQLLEKATLFWHGHFATGADKVKDASMMWQQNRLLRQQALGNFSELVQAIAKDPAMLIYLDSASNRKAHPNENFARELMELFCLGEGHYSEQDVQELARCFTGWEIKNDRFRKNRYQHDNGVKRLLGKEGAFDGEAAVEIVIDQPSMPLFLCRKWFRFFVCDEPAPPDKLLMPLAETFRDRGYDIAPVLQKLFSSNLFFSSLSVGRKIKSPVESLVGTLRSLQGTTNTELLARGLRDIGQGLFYPPNVKGWDGGRAWINSSTLLGRANLFQQVLNDSNTAFAGNSLQEYLGDQGIETPQQALQQWETRLLPHPLPSPVRSRLLQSFASGNSAEDGGFRDLLHQFVSLPECQLG
ncbi:DUF1800 domain-containing protein [Roseiconus nitratireducens]|uniref:DUF1800 domain-containing protein n=1 Tax=Roseiconus nitratireducens TaxID=2605748 RepID=A0A5M6D578_9BACT|nr:DUF1800 domain-containing protein [Roseiconus nitratireducens]KAA5541462.1 DUF1800 domain-containing protein [Roseiconus nitratireducens]